MSSLVNFLEWVNANTGVCYLILTVIVLPFLKTLADKYKEKVALTNLLGALTRGAEVAVDMLVSGKPIDRAFVYQKAMEYAASKFPDAVQRLKPSEATLTDMAIAQAAPVLRDVEAKAAAVAAGLVAGALAGAGVEGPSARPVTLGRGA